MDKTLLSVLVCPECKSKLDIQDNTLRCQNKNCLSEYSIKKNIPIMLTGGAEPAAEKSGYYPRVKGGTMEDNPDEEFRNYDTKIRTRYLRKYLANESTEGLILDLGCSKAPFYRFLKEWGYQDKVVGVDLLFHQLEVAYQRGVKAVVANTLKLPFRDAQFSKVIFTDILVHLLKREDQIDAFSEITRVLKKDGILLLTATSALSRAAKRSPVDYCTYYTKSGVLELAGKTRYILENFDRKNSSLALFWDKVLNNIITKKFGMVYFLKFRRI